MVVFQVHEIQPISKNVKPLSFSKLGKAYDNWLTAWLSGRVPGRQLLDQGSMFYQGLM